MLSQQGQQAYPTSSSSDSSACTRLSSVRMLSGLHCPLPGPPSTPERVPLVRGVLGEDAWASLSSPGGAASFWARRSARAAARAAAACLGAFVMSLATDANTGVNVHG